MKSLKLTSTKKGAASIYVVVFATILFGVIVLSFMRIILSESSQTSNDDLSQSAYDAAMAGVEDAKIAVNKYYQCMSSGGFVNDCKKYEDIFSPEKCEEYNLGAILHGMAEGEEIKISESGNGDSNNTDQAYTCVLLSNKVEDYRSTLTSDTRTRVVPIGIGSDLSQVKYIKFEWYSELNGTSFSMRNDGLLHKKSEATVPPTISLSLLKTGSEFTIDSFNNSTSGDFSTMILLPSQAEEGKDDESIISYISQDQINKAGESEFANEPFKVKCGQGAFACSITLGVDDDKLVFANGGNAMLIVSLPYGDTITDFAVTLYGDGGTSSDPISFENVQVSVDSTGRTNQLVRRVESRLDPADVYFPYPQYEVELNGSDENTLLKNFWITANCWTEAGTCPNNGVKN